MQKGESIISVALAGVLMLAVIAVHRRWQPASIKEMASSAGEFILSTTGIRGQVPDISGYERVKDFPLGRLRAALYRASPAPLVFAPGLFVIYSRDNKPVFKVETLEGSHEPWTTLYDFAGKAGLTQRRSRPRPAFVRNLAGTSAAHVILGQYSGGDHCCTTATIVELGPEGVRVVGRIGRLDGLPFEGLEMRNLDQDPAMEFIAHRPYRTLCGPHADAADDVSVYDYIGDEFSDQTGRHVAYLRDVLRQNLQKWSKEKERSLQLLQTLAVRYARLGDKEQGKRFFAMNLPVIVSEVQKKGVDPNACLEDVEALLGRMTSARQ